MFQTYKRLRLLNASRTLCAWHQLRIWAFAVRTFLVEFVKAFRSPQ
jgi:hypothetical protein